MGRICRAFGAALIAALAASAADRAAFAESPPPPAADARADAQKSAFLAMPEADRKGVQDALGWLGLYNGAVDGGWGKRTRDSLLAYQSGAGATPDGVVTAGQLAALKEAAGRARALVGFEVVEERRSGVRIGAPLKLLAKIVMVDGDATIETTDGEVTLAIAARTGDQASLSGLYAKLTAETSSRKLTYKAMKTDEFFVAAGEAAGRKFYSRFAKSPADWPGGPVLRGFTFAYPKDKAGDLDKVALAIANSFEPFGPSGSRLDTAARESSNIDWRDIVRTASGGGASPPAPAAGQPAAPRAPTLIATGLVVAPGEALTALAAADCADPTVDGKPAKSLRRDAATGLTLLAGEFGATARAPDFGAGSSELVVLSFTTGAAPDKPKLEASPAPLAPAVDGPPAIVAPLTKSASGAPAFNRNGGLEGLVAPVGGEPARIAGVALAAPHALIDREAIERFLGVSVAAPEARGAELGAGEIARDKRAALAPVVCRP
jgi:putative peptidoglycan binding protein